MSILSIQNVTMGFEDRVLFSGVSLMMQPGERVALVGPNGCGKTTLMRLIMGELQPEEGAVVLGRAVRLGYSQQESGSDRGAENRTVYEEALAVFEPLLRMEAELERLNDALRHAHSDDLLHRQSELHDVFVREGGLTFRARARSTLLGLGFAEAEHTMWASRLSGGQQAKLRLGRLLLSGADLLLLDEPTNHLDIKAIVWLEGFLADYPGAVLLVSHDRWFLDQTATRTAELSHGRMTVWKGGYSEARRQKELQAEQDRRHYENQMEEIQRIEGIIEQQRRFGQKRNFITIASKQKQIDRLRADVVVPEACQRGLRFQFPEVPPTGQEVLRLKGLSKSFGEKRLFSNVSTLIEKGDRVFLLGANGCGKTTLLRILRRQLRPDDGAVIPGANVKLGSYDQDVALLRSGKTVLDEIWDNHRALNQTEVRSLLGAFLFSGDVVFQRADTLSGGERARLALLKLMMSGANLLLLDEPTNHLDAASREALETALAQFGGTVIAVSHDRYFIKKLATKIYRLHPGGLEFCGNSYEEYQARAAEETKAGLKKEPDSPNKRDRINKKEAAAGERKRRAALSRCEGEIARLEEESEGLRLRLEDPAAAADYEALVELTAQLEAAQTVLEERLAEWEELQECME
ncbi:MAG: ABC-F family ATP-binding cassette domain-containing protein [Oscillospiraceae bacterium]|nr:ABC-F family ATP-binding cassette domain-containing protein [Oscillospiraceae bacterium]